MSRGAPERTARGAPRPRGPVLAQVLLIYNSELLRFSESGRHAFQWSALHHQANSDVSARLGGRGLGVGRPGLKFCFCWLITAIRPALGKSPDFPEAA